MNGRSIVWLALAVALSAPAVAFAQAEAPVLEAPAAEIAVPLVETVLPPIRLEAEAPAGTAAAKDAPTAPGEAPAPHIGLSAERAQLLLRSLTVPGWGQLTAGHNTAATVFGLAELAVWTSFTSFRIQSQLRRDSYERTAHLLAHVDIQGRDEEFRRIIGSYLSSEEYNQLVVYREAASLYYDDPVAYRQYIATHSVGGADAWSWDSEAGLLRYRAQRRDAQRAGIRANTALACAVVNRLLSVVHAARIPTASRSWNLEIAPGPDHDVLTCRVAVRTRF